MKNISLIAIAAVTSLVVSGCSSTNPMTTGDRISQRGGVISDFGDSWSQGENDVEQGRKSVAKSAKRLADGEKDLERARQKVAEAEAQISAARSARISGEQQIESGRTAMERAEAAYSATKAGPSALPTAN
ncbi:MAG: hypothetical protein O9293_07480 [Porphyrobacter sp.]|nr:hypothetical protein [Porphyrobacter sp.]